jgi:hypothetical protein
MADASAGGTTVGIAQGIIRIDTSALARDRNTVVREAKIMGDALATQIGQGAERGAQQATSAMARVTTALMSVVKAGQLAAVGLTLGGIRSATHLRQLNALFRTLSGSQTKANALMADMEALAERTHQPFLGILESAVALYPALRLSNANLNQTILLAQRMAILDPAQGISGAAFALREFLSGEYISLSRRFEMDRKRLRQIIAEADGDQAKAIEGLSRYVDELGLSEQAMIDMNASGVNAFSILRGELTMTLSEGLEPTVEALSQIAMMFAGVAKQIRDVNPDLVKLLGTLTAIVGLSQAAGAVSLIPGIGKIPGAAAIGRAGALAATGYGGMELGVYGARKLGGDRFEGRSQGDVREELFTRIKQMLVAAFSTLGDLVGILQAGGMLVENTFGQIGALLAFGAGELGNGLASLVDVIADAAASIATTIAGYLEKLSQLQFKQTFEIAGIKKTVDLGQIDVGTMPEDLRKLADGLGTVDDGLRTSDERLEAYAKRVARGNALTQSQGEMLAATSQAWDDMTLSLGEGLGVFTEMRSAFDIWNDALEVGKGLLMTVADQARMAVAAQDLQITDELLDAWDQFQDDLKEVDQQAQEDREEELKDHEERKAEIIRNYQQQVTDLLEEEQLRYERALEDARRREGDIRADMADSIAESDQELAETLTDLRAEYHEGDEKATTEHFKRLRDLQRDGRQAIARAAMRLDAIGIWEAQQALKERLKDEKESYKEEQDERRQQYQEALNDATAAHDKQIQKARDSANEQTRLLWERFAREEQMQREDTQRRLDKMRQDQQAQLTQQDTQHLQRMAQIDRQAQSERTALETHWGKVFTESQNHLAGLEAIEKTHRDSAERALREWWERNEQYYIPFTPQVTGMIGDIQNFLGFQHGGKLPHTGLFYGHEGEEVLNRDTAQWLRRMMGGDISPAGLAAQVGGGRGGSGAWGPITVNYPEGSQGWSRYDLERFFDDRLNAFMKKVGARP